MDWSVWVDPDRLMSDLIVCLVLSLAFTIVFGVSRRLFFAAAAICLGIDLLYPGGSTALVADSLRPLRSLEDGAIERSAAHDAQIDAATADGPTARGD